MSDTQNKLSSLTVNDLLSAYNGKAGCCCGCRGTYSYVKVNQEAAGKNRGDDVMDDEVNDKKVANILKRMQANAASVEDLGGGCLTLDLGIRVYILNLKETSK